MTLKEKSKERVFCENREEKNKRVFFDCFSSQKYSCWNQEGVHSLERLGDQRE